MFKNLKIGVRLGIGFAVTLIFLITIASIRYVRPGDSTAISSYWSTTASQKRCRPST